MLIPISSQSVAYYALMPVFWPLFILIYYIVPALISPVIMKHCFKASGATVRQMIIGGMWGFFFALPFVQVISNSFIFLFVISTRSLLVFALASIVFQFLYLWNVAKLSVKQLLLHLALVAMLGYWFVCVTYYVLSQVFMVVSQLM